MGVFRKNRKIEVNLGDDNVQKLTKEDLMDALKKYKDACEYMNLGPSLKEEDVSQYLKELSRSPVPIDEFVDFYHDTPKVKTQKVMLYLKALTGVDFVVDFFIFDPRLNVFDCYGDFKHSDCDVLNRCNNVSSFFTDEEDAGRVVVTGNNVKIKLNLYDEDYNEVFPDILLARLFEIIDHRGDIY